MPGSCGEDKGTARHRCSSSNHVLQRDYAKQGSCMTGSLQGDQTFEWTRTSMQAKGESYWRHCVHLDEMDHFPTWQEKWLHSKLPSCIRLTDISFSTGSITASRRFTGSAILQLPALQRHKGCHIFFCAPAWQTIGQKYFSLQNMFPYVIWYDTFAFFFCLFASK